MTHKYIDLETNQPYFKKTEDLFYASSYFNGVRVSDGSSGPYKMEIFKIKDGVATLSYDEVFIKHDDTTEYRYNF